MQARISPTSPAAKKNVEDVAAVWNGGKLQQPPKTPWGRLTLMVILVTLILNLATVAAFGWYVHRYPTSWFARFAPLTSTTTVVQASKDAPTDGKLPAAVERLLSSAYGIARNQGEKGVYRSNDVLGVAWPLSGSGWTVTVTGAWPSDIKTLAILPAVGQPLAITNTLSDSGSQFVFLKSTEVSAQPITLGVGDDVAIGGSVWVTDGTSAVTRRMVQVVRPRWASSDRDETFLKLDGPVMMPVGAAVVTPEGRFIGLLGSDSRVWLLPSITTVVKQVIQQASISRPILGITTLNRATARISQEPSATGFLIGADDAGTAINAKSPAETAGLKAGDVITAIDGQLPTETLFSALSTYQAGDKVNVTFVRAEKEKTVSVTLGSSRP